MNIRKGLLFIFLAIPGALLSVFATIVIIGKIFDPNGVPTNYVTLIFISSIGLIMTVVGLEKIRQWKYIFVFLSIPFSFFLAGLIAPIVVMMGLPWLLFPVTATLVFLAPYFVNKIVKKQYDKSFTKSDSKLQ